MAQARPIIDITDKPELLRLVEHVRESREPIILRASGEDVAEVMPIARTRPSRNRTKSQADFEAFLSTFGAWDDVDAEELKAQLRAARGSNRPHVKL